MVSKKILFKISPPIWPIFSYEISMIISEIKKKNKVTILACDGLNLSKEFCHANPNSKKIICDACKSKFQNTMKLLEDKQYEIIYPNYKKKYINFINTDIKKKLNLGVNSTIYTLFKIDKIYSKYNPFKKKLLKESIFIFNFFHFIFKKNNFNLIYIFNGRHYDYRSALEFALIKNIKFYCYDISNYSKRLIISKNTYPHNLLWRSVNVYKTFLNNKKKFNKKIISQFMQDRLGHQKNNPIAYNYNTSQKKNSLPKMFNKSNINIVIYNTALWEYKSLVENKKLYLFSSDIHLIKFVSNFFKKNKKVKIFFRCHPNFATEKKTLNNYKEKISKLKNVFFIPPLSDCNSIELAKKSNLIINFGSTIALESAYYGKNVITLAPNIFSKFKFQKIPKNLNQFKKMIHDALSLKKINVKQISKEAKNAIYAANLEGREFKDVKFINSRKVLLKYSGSYNLIKPECFNDLLYKFNLVIEKSIELFKYLLTDFNYFLYKIKNLKRKL